MAKLIDTLLADVIASSTARGSRVSDSPKYAVDDPFVTFASTQSVDLGVGHTDERRLHEDTVPALFAGCRVFAVDPDVFQRCRLGKRRYARYEEYVGASESGDAIRTYGRSRHGRKGIILLNKVTGAMLYLRYPGNYHLPTK